MRRACLLALLLSLGGLSAGCGGAEPAAHPSASCEATSGAEVGAVGVASADAARVAELEARLAESSAEVTTLRAELARAHRERDDASVDPDFTVVETDDDAPVADGRPVLRLYGAPTPPPSQVAVLAGPPAPSIVAAPPTGAIGRLPVVLTPGAPDSVPAIPTTPVLVAPDAPLPAAPSAEDTAAADEYRAALAHVTAREWDLALDALGRFVAEHPGHAYADNAMYWRGEVLYARRDYAAAITELTHMIERFPQGNKVPDALLRIGFAYQRLGESERARDVFRRVREQFPGTVAARMASREDA